MEADAWVGNSWGMGILYCYVSKVLVLGTAPLAMGEPRGDAGGF